MSGRIRYRLVISDKIQGTLRRIVNVTEASIERWSGDMMDLESRRIGGHDLGVAM